MTKHIVNIVPAFVPGDGIGNSARARVRGLLEGGYQVSVICATAKVAENEFPGLRLMQAGAGWEAERTSLTTEMEAAVRSADLIFVEFGCFNICHELLHQVAVPLILFYQGITPAVLMQNDMYTACYWRAVGELRKMPQPAMVLAASQFTLDEYTRNTGHEASQSRVVPLFGNTREVSSPPVPISRRPFKVLAVGQLFPHKNYEVLIEATKLLVGDGLDVEVQHIGGANDLIALGYRSKLQSFASSLGSRFKFLGRVDQDVLDEAYADAHVVVVPSLHEGYSLPVREALVHGKPVVASSFGALPETLQGVGRIFHPLDAAELARVLAEYAAMHDSEWAHECEQAKTTAKSHSVERYVHGCISAIEEALHDQTPIPIASVSDTSCHVDGHEYLDDSEDSISGRVTFAVSHASPVGEMRSALEGSAKAYTPAQIWHCPADIDVTKFSLEALIVSSRHVLRTRMTVRTHWKSQVPSGHAVCAYELPLAGIEDCTAIYFAFVDSKTGEREWRLSGFQRERKPRDNGNNASRELRRLSLAIAESYSPKSVIAADGRLLTKFKTKVANTILKLVYQVFVGPQMAAMQSQLRLLEAAIDELKNKDKNTLPQQPTARLDGSGKPQ